METLAEAVNSLTVDVDRKIEEKAAAARAAEEVRRKTHLSRVRKELSEAARTCTTRQPLSSSLDSARLVACLLCLIVCWDGVFAIL